MDGKHVLRIDGLCKSFAGNTVLHPVRLDIMPGEFHALIGENGAGKSTLINLVTGVYEPDDGMMAIGGKEYKKLSPAQAKRLDIHAVHQELSLNRHLTVAENVFLGDEIIHKGVFRDKKAMHEKTAELLRSMGLDIDPRALAGSLPLPEQQLLEFAKAVSKNPKLLILDEATSALNTGQVSLMFGILRELKKTGLSVLFISHRLKELFDLCDSMTVLKDGKQIVTEPISGFDQDRLVSLMTGREIGGLFPPKDAARLAGSREFIKLSHVETRHLRDISFSVREGEILGIGGLAGQGQSYVLEALFGVEKIKRGTVHLRGEAVSFSSPLKAMEKGIAYLPADRKTESLFLIHSIRFNMSIAHLDAISDRVGTVRAGIERAGNAAMCEKMQVKMRGQEQAAGELSGGNQQKAVVGKWLLREPSVLLLNEPTRGIDVGTKKQIYELLRTLARQGITILLLSSDTLELVGLCDRVIVLYENQVNSEIDAEHLTEETLVSASVFKKGRQ